MNIDMKNCNLENQYCIQLCIQLGASYPHYLYVKRIKIVHNIFELHETTRIKN
jgi:hypothetical protein